MYRMIAHWLVSLALLFAVLLGALRVAGSVIPETSDASTLERSLCTLPCVFGVTPGITTEAQTLEALAAYSNVRQVSTREIALMIPDYAGRPVRIAFHSNWLGRIQAIQVESGVQKIDLAQLGDLLLMGLKPTHVIYACERTRPERFLITFGANDELQAQVTAVDAFSPEIPVTMIDVATTGWRPGDDPRRIFSCSMKADWLGFAPLWRYLT